MRALTRTALLVLALGGSGCGGDTQFPLDSTGGQGIQAQPGPLARADLLLHIAHQGVRRVAFAAPSGSSITFRERITTDGAGHFSIEPVEPLSSTLMDWTAFDLLQRLREGYLFRYRDFAVRDALLFQRNWRWISIGPETVAARSCERYRVQRTAGAPALYEVSVDLTNGMVLAYRQLDGSGGVIASMEYESLELSPDVSGVAWHQPSNQESELDWRSDLVAEVGSPILQPRLLPEGYALRAASTVVDGQERHWLKLTYLDGVEPLFFLQVLPGGKVQQGVDAGMDWTAGETPAPVLPKVVVYQLGSTAVAQGTIGEHELIAIGKVPEAELLDLIESSLP